MRIVKALKAQGDFQRLAHASDHTLRDIGLSRDEVQRHIWTGFQPDPKLYRF